jgi:hypothetical protein
VSPIAAFTFRETSQPIADCLFHGNFLPA